MRVIPDLDRYDAIFSPYSDCGIFGHYFFGNAKYAQHMAYAGGIIGEIMSEYLNDVEVTRAKNKMYNEILSIHTASDQMQQYGPQFLMLGRKVPRSEIATRISSLDAKQLREVCKRWFVEKEPSFTSWGPMDDIAENGLYNSHKVVLQNMLENKHFAIL